ncbi:MAG: hypothetical protein H0U65_15160 [Rubrobacter sp.]|nr:hypothetical protein [Rubrobacter sp.]
MTMKTVGALLLFLAALLLFAASPARAAEFTVTSNADSGEGTLRQAIDAANANAEADTITFNLLEGERKITLKGQVEIRSSQPLTIDGAEEVTLSGGNTNRILFVNNSTLTLRALTLTDGNDGGFDSGGAIFSNAGSTLTVEGSTFSQNSATFFGGAIRNNGTMTV